MFFWKAKRKRLVTTELYKARQTGVGDGTGMLATALFIYTNYISTVCKAAPGGRENSML